MERKSIIGRNFVLEHDERDSASSKMKYSGSFARQEYREGDFCKSKSINVNLQILNEKK